MKVVSVMGPAVPTTAPPRVSHDLRLPPIAEAQKMSPLFNGIGLTPPPSTLKLPKGPFQRTICMYWLPLLNRE